MLNTPYKLEDLGLGPSSLNQVTVDGLVSRKLPGIAVGNLRLYISGTLAKALMEVRALDAHHGKSEDGMITVPFASHVLDGWRACVLQETKGGIFTSLEGNGIVREDRLDQKPMFVLGNGRQLFPIPQDMVWRVTGADFYFENPHYSGEAVGGV